MPVSLQPWEGAVPRAGMGMGCGEGKQELLELRGATAAPQCSLLFRLREEVQS